VISQEMERSEPSLGVRIFRISWLVVAVWVDGELSEKFAGDGGDDADVEITVGERRAVSTR